VLLYIFWHWPRPETAIASYEADEAVFQQAVRDAAPEGLMVSAVFYSKGSPWANEGAAAYEDVYVLESSAALDALNREAVQGACKEPHDRLAGEMLAGAAGLYSLSLGNPVAVPVGPARWFRKPPGMAYEALYASIADANVGQATSLWRRQMVLSPASEFCAFGFDPAEALAGLEPIMVQRSLRWSSVTADSEP